MASVLLHGEMWNVSNLVLSGALDEHNLFLCGNKISVPHSCIIPESSITDTSEIYTFLYFSTEKNWLVLILLAVGFKKLTFSTLLLSTIFLVGGQGWYDQFNSSPCTLVSCRIEKMFAYQPGALVNAGAALSLLRLMVLYKYWDVWKNILQKEISQDMNTLHSLDQYLKLWNSIIFWSRWQVISFKLSSVTSIFNDSVSEVESVCVHSIVIMNC